ncbi:MAG TPA: PEP-CTERM sorting domain-containing protein [Casimicrobiaceae bacterium]|nr:PEP-CTERM sorting domain-containing protein [Casimicrobiaceae bacterium]
MQLRILKMSLGALAAAWVLSPAQAAPMTGLIGFGDGLQTTLALPTTIVNGLTTIDMFNQPGASTVGPCLGDFASLGCPTTGQATDFSFGNGDQIVFTAGSFVFHFLTVPNAPPVGEPLVCVPRGTVQQCSDKWTFNGVGYVHDTTNTFTDTLVLISFALTGNCIDSNNDNACDSNWGGNYASTITATGQTLEVPEPASMALIGLGLLALGATRRRRQS